MISDKEKIKQLRKDFRSLEIRVAHLEMMREIMHTDVRQNIICQGQDYIEKGSEEVYKLCYIGSRHMALISMENGACWNEGTEVQNTSKLTVLEFSKICGTGNFVLKGD